MNSGSIAGGSASSNRKVMRKSPPRNKEELLGRNVTIRCPHCGDRVSLVPCTGPVIDLYERAHFIGQCPNYKSSHCRPIFAVYEALNDRVVEVYPMAGHEADDFDAAIPVGIRRDFAEAKRCFSASSFKGSVALLRRVVEAAACEVIGEDSLNSKGRTKQLEILVDLMHERGLITNHIRDAAHAIRLFGNYGAHVQNDGLDAVTRDEAREVEEITWQILYSIFVVSRRTEALRKRLASKERQDDQSDES